MTTPECTNCQELQTKLDNLQGEMDRVKIALDYLEEQLDANDISTGRYIDTLKTTIDISKSTINSLSRSLWFVAFQTILLLVMILYKSWV